MGLLEMFMRTWGRLYRLLLSMILIIMMVMMKWWSYSNDDPLSNSKHSNQHRQVVCYFVMMHLRKKIVFYMPQHFSTDWNEDSTHHSRWRKHLGSKPTNRKIGQFPLRSARSARFLVGWKSVGGPGWSRHTVRSSFQKVQSSIFHIASNDIFAFKRLPSFVASL